MSKFCHTRLRFSVVDTRLHPPYGLENQAYTLEDQSQRKLNLPWSVRASGCRKVGRPAIVGRKVIDSNSLVYLRKVRCRIRETVIGDLHASIIAIQALKASATNSSLRRGLRVENPPRSCCSGYRFDPVAETAE